MREITIRYEVEIKGQIKVKEKTFKDEYAMGCWVEKQESNNASNFVKVLAYSR
jgi:hypothetical protein